MRSLKDRPLMKRQCAYLLGWHQYMGYDEDEEDELDEEEAANYPILETNKEIEDYEIEFTKILNGEVEVDDNKDQKADDDDDEDEDLPDINDIIGNVCGQ